MQVKRTIPQRAFDDDALIDRFWSKVAVGDADACWPFVGRRNQHGYGQIEVLSEAHPAHPAHRVAWAVTQGANVPEGLLVLHRCDNPPCCNPAHLFLGTQFDNMRDRKNKGREASQRGVKNGHAVLTEADVREIRASAAAGGRTYADIGSDYGVTPMNVWQIVRRKSWQHVL